MRKVIKIDGFVAVFCQISHLVMEISRANRKVQTVFVGIFWWHADIVVHQYWNF